MLHYLSFLYLPNIFEYLCILCMPNIFRFQCFLHIHISSDSNVFYTSHISSDSNAFYTSTYLRIPVYFYRFMYKSMTSLTSPIPSFNSFAISTLDFPCSYNSRIFWLWFVFSLACFADNATP